MNNHSIRLSIFATVVFASLSMSAQAATSSIGIGAGAIDSPYKGGGGIASFFPAINYESEYMYFYGVKAGAYLFKNDAHKINLGVAYLPLGFKPSKSDDDQMKELNRRKTTLLAELGYSYSASWGQVSASIAGDILNESDSILAFLSYSYSYRHNSWTLIPTVGMMWANDDHNNYYYGVSHDEANRSGFAYYNAKSSVSVFTQLVTSYRFTDNISTSLGVRYDQLTGDVKNSPIIADSGFASVFASINYRF